MIVERLVITGFLGAVMLAIYLIGMKIPPFKPAWRLLERSLLGAAVLAVWNLIATPFGLFLGINPLTALAVGTLGVPGLGLLLVIQAM